jgi:hypothetical protein
LDQDVDLESDVLEANNSDIEPLLGKKCDGRLILIRDESLHPRLQLVTFSFKHPQLIAILSDVNFKEVTTQLTLNCEIYKSMTSTILSLCSKTICL